MKKALDSIYRFLSENREYNKKFQEKYFKSIISGRSDLKNKVVSLLYTIANTQSGPTIDCLAKFYRFIYDDTKSLTSFTEIVKRISGSDDISYLSLFDGLNNSSGWGPKTAALFTKVIFKLHNETYDENLKLWDDAPTTVNDNDRLYLPVDSVIIKIFEEIGCKKPNFTSINNVLRKYYKGAEIEVWDDLWFWGFMNQKGSGNSRVLEWNENKYWSQEYSSKNVEEIEKIRYKSKIFLRLLSMINRKSI